MRRLILTLFAVLAAPATVLAQLPRDGATAGQHVLSPTLTGERVQSTLLHEYCETARRSPFDQQRQSLATGL